MTCNCEQAKSAYIVINRAGLSTNTAVICLKCGKVWHIKDVK